jgi:hypothetical protein
LAWAHFLLHDLLSNFLAFTDNLLSPMQVAGMEREAGCGFRGDPGCAGLLLLRTVAVLGMVAT